MEGVKRRRRPTDSQIAGMAMTLEPSAAPLHLLATALALEYNLLAHEARDYANRMTARSFAEIVPAGIEMFRFELTGQRELECGDCNSPMFLDVSTAGLRYRCTATKCRGTHGAHPDGSPLGAPADEATRRARIEAHKALDTLWSDGEQRLNVYAWLARKLGIPLEKCHIAMFDKERCRRVVELVRHTDQAFIPRRKP